MERFKTKFKYAVFMLLLFDTGSFGASEATKKLIHETLAKYGISAGGKEVCGKDTEPICEEKGCKVRCNRYGANNYWSPKDRLCKECPLGTILNKTTFQSCNQVNCPEGTVGTIVSDGKCPAGMELYAPNEGICPEGMEIVSPSKKTCPDGYELQKVTNGKCPDGFELIDLRKSCPSGYEMFKQS